MYRLPCFINKSHKYGCNRFDSLEVATVVRTCISVITIQSTVRQSSIIIILENSDEF